MKREPQRASIGRTARVVGRVTGDGDLLVEGRVEGELTLGGLLHVAAGGVVVAPVSAEEVTLEGEVEGDVVARGAVVLRGAAKLRGVIRAGRVGLEDGARFTGRIEMDVELPRELTAGSSAHENAPARGRKG